MVFRRVAEPETEPVTLEQMRAQLRLEPTLESGADEAEEAENDLIADYISEARAHIEDSCHRVFVESEWEWILDSFAAGYVASDDTRLLLPIGPLISVDSIEYDDEDEAEQTLDAADYTVTAGSYGYITVGDDGWPTTFDGLNAVRITFTAGYSNASGLASVPLPIRQAIRLLAAHWFQNREAVAAGSMAEIPLGVERLIGPYRVPVLK